MNFKELSTPDNLEKYSFLWSEARLLIASVALFLGGVPPVLLLSTDKTIIGILSLLLKLAWIISGLAAGYLVYRWNLEGQKLFGKKDMKATIAFFVCIISGFNLGITGLLNTNIGMSMSTNHTVFDIVGAAYVVSAVYLLMRWKSAGRRLFPAESAM